MLVITKPYHISLLEWKVKRFVKAIISPVDNEDAPPRPIKRNLSSSTSSAPVTPISVPPVTTKYQNPPPRQNNNLAGAEDWAGAIIKVACILVIGIVILNSVVMSTQINTTSPFAPVFDSLQASLSMGYVLAALMVVAIGAGAIIHMLGFM